MNFTRVIISTMMICSLQSTLFCAQESRTLTRKKSFDVTRDGNLIGKQNRYQWALDHDGQDYTHWKTACEVRPGSDEQAIARYEEMGKTGITTVENAHKFLNLIHRNNLQLSQEALTPAQKLITNAQVTGFKESLLAKSQNRAEQNADLDQLEQTLNNKIKSEIVTAIFLELNKDCKLALRNHHDEVKLRPYITRSLLTQQQAQLEQLKAEHQAQLQDLRNQHQQTDVTLLTSLAENYATLQDLQTQARELQTPINQKPFIEKPSLKLTPDVVECLSVKYSSWGKKQYADVVADSAK